MSIRTAIATALVDGGVASESSPERLIIIVDRIVNAIVRDSHVNENAEKPGLWALVSQAIAPSTLPPNEVIYRLRQSGVVITIDQQRINFGGQS